MTANEKRNLLVEKALTRRQKNQYSQDVNKRTLIESGFGDCSGTTWYWYHKLFGMNIGANTEAQINSKLGKEIDITIKNGIPDETKMRKGDLLYFRGSDDSRTRGVGHVEMYIGNGQCFGHGSGLGGTVKDMKAYCKQRYSQKSTTKLKNKGLICVKRFIEDDFEELFDIDAIVWEYKHRGIISDSNLWISKAKREKNTTYWLLQKTLQYIRLKEENNVISSQQVDFLEDSSANVWELWYRGIISDKDLWCQKAKADINLQWFLYKVVYFIRSNNI